MLYIKVRHCSENWLDKGIRVPVHVILAGNSTSFSPLHPAHHWRRNQRLNRQVWWPALKERTILINVNSFGVDSLLGSFVFLTSITRFTVACFLLSSTASEAHALLKFTCNIIFYFSEEYRVAINEILILMPSNKNGSHTEMALVYWYGYIVFCEINPSPLIAS